MGWPVPAESYYFLQACVGVPLIGIAFWVLCWVLKRMLPAEGKAPGKASNLEFTQAIGRAYSGCLWGLFLVPDLCLYGIGEFDLLRRGAPVVLSGLGAGTVLILALALRTRGTSLPRAFGASILGVLAQGVVIGLFWR